MKNSIFSKILFVLLLLINIDVFAKNLIIEGNQYTDDDIVISIIGQISDGDNKTTSDFILKKPQN